MEYTGFLEKVTRTWTAEREYKDHALKVLQQANYRLFTRILNDVGDGITDIPTLLEYCEANWEEK